MRPPTVVMGTPSARQGKRGRMMVPSDHAAQGDAYIKQGALGNKTPEGEDAEPINFHKSMINFHKSRERWPLP